MPAPAPSAEPIDGVLADVARFRSALSADLLAAAAAVDADAPDVAADIVSGDRAELASLRDAVFRRLLPIVPQPGG